MNACNCRPINDKQHKIGCPAAKPFRKEGETSTVNCNCGSTTRVHSFDCPGREGIRTPVNYDCRPGDILVIPNYLGENLDHAFMVLNTFPSLVDLCTPHGTTSRLAYVDLLVLGAYYIWNRPVKGPQGGIF